MPMYVVLGRFTDDGVKHLKDWRQTMQETRANAEKLGMKLHGWYMTQGQYDFVVLAEAPDDEAMLKQSLWIGGRGNSRSETLRAYPIEEAQNILQQIG